MPTPSILTRRQFLRATALATGGMTALRLSAADAPLTEVPPRRLERLATGANICRWFRFPRNETPEHFDRYLPESEVEMIARMGLKHVRLCIAPKILMEQTS